jgi:hypothetical protein
MATVLSGLEVRYSIGGDLCWRSIFQHMALSGRIGIVVRLLLTVFILADSTATVVVVVVGAIVFAVGSIDLGESVFFVDHYQIFVHFSCGGICAARKHVPVGPSAFDVAWSELNLGC